MPDILWLKLDAEPADEGPETLPVGVSEVGVPGLGDRWNAMRSAAAAAKLIVLGSMRGNGDDDMSCRAVRLIE